MPAPNRVPDRVINCYLAARASARRSARDWRGPTGSLDGGFDDVVESFFSSASNIATRSRNDSLCERNVSFSARSDSLSARRTSIALSASRI